jgi:TIR domain
MAAQGRAIFISYRRDDSEGESGRLFDDLVRAYGDDSVFMDVAGIQPGLDFRKAIDDNVASCGVLLAVIGPTWATVTGSDGSRRLENQNDYVRLEIGSALKRGIPVIPVLVHEAHMPPLEQLPDDLKDLRYRNSVELTHARWNSDVALLVTALKSYVGAESAHPEATVHATVPVQLPAPQAAPTPASAGKSRMPLFAGLGAAVIVLAVVGFMLMRRDSAAGVQQAATGSSAATTTPVSTTPATTTPTTTTPAMTTPTAASGTPASTAPATATGSQPSDAPSAGAGSGMPAALLGKWKNVNEQGGDSLARLEVVDFEGRLMVQAWGKCPDKYCDWGSKRTKMVGSEAVTDTWVLRNTPKETQLQRSVTLSLLPTADGLQVTVKNRFLGANGQLQDTYNQARFTKVP